MNAPLPSPPKLHRRAEAMARLVEMSRHPDAERVEITGTEDRNELTGQPVTRWRCSVWLGGSYISALHNSVDLAVDVVWRRFERRYEVSHAG